VRKILRSGETDFSYERERQPMPRLGPWQGQLEHFLSANAGKPAYSGTSGHPFRSHPATCSDAFGHL
ncbi:MAG: hypothetical protein WBP18_18365, partial [Paracoccaceae bacterium]